MSTIEREKNQYGIVNANNIRIISPFTSEYITRKELEFILNKLLEVLADSRSEEDRLILKDAVEKMQEQLLKMQEQLLATRGVMQNAIARNVYQPVSVAMGIGSLSVAVVFGILGSLPLALLFVLGSAFGFLTFRRLKNLFEVDKAPQQ